MDNMLNRIVPEYNKNLLVKYFADNPVTDLKYKSFFPGQYKTGLTFGNIEGETGAKVIAPIVAMDSDVMLKGRTYAQSVTGDIPKIEVGRKMNERDLFHLAELRRNITPNNGNAATQLLDKIYSDAIFVRESVNASLELMSKQLLSNGFYTDNKGIKIDFGVTVQNAAKDWYLPANAETFDPIKELMGLQKVALGQGFRYQRMVMDLATFNQFVSAQSVIKFTASFAQNALGLAMTPTRDQLNSALASQNLPLIDIWESYVNDEKEDGSLVPTSGWELGNIHLSGTPDFGNTQYTISVEADMDLGETSKITADDFILISTIGSAAPIQVLTKGTAFATPVLNSVSKRLILKTKLA